jgi:hypothetical protein
MRELLRYRRNVHSQKGEDGVLAELLRRLRVDKGWFCEFGAWDGRYLSNTLRLLEEGWSGVMIEGDPVRSRDLQKTVRDFDGRLHAIEAFVDHCPGPRTLDALLAATPIPREFEVLSIDVDGPDYQIWESFTSYRPLLVIIEIHSGYPPGHEHIHTDGAPSSSFTSMIKLGRTKGYVPLVHTGNLFFIRADKAGQVCAGDASCRGAEQQFLFNRQSASGSAGRMLRYCWQRLEERLRRGALSQS